MFDKNFGASLPWMSAAGSFWVLMLISLSAVSLALVMRAVKLEPAAETLTKNGAALFSLGNLRTHS